VSLTDDQITDIACKHCKFVPEGMYLYKQFEFKSSLVAFVRECIDAATPQANGIEPGSPDDIGTWGGAFLPIPPRASAAPAASVAAKLQDPVAVHVAMLRGEIAKPAIRDMLHAYGADALAQYDRGAASVAGLAGAVGSGKSLSAAVADALRPYLGDGEKVIWCEPFRWKDDDGVMPNHFEGMSVQSLATEFGYEVVHDCGCAAVIRSALAAQAASTRAGE
jgi:hypothetical protein